MNLRFIDTAQATGENAFLPSQFDFVSVILGTFLHFGLRELALNMVFLYMFGDNVENVLGFFLFASFYLLSGILAGFGHYAVYGGSMVPLSGAAGCVSGVLGAYLVLFPHSRALVSFGKNAEFETSMLLALPVWFVGQGFIGLFLTAVGYPGGSCISNSSGFMVGVAFGFLVRKLGILAKHDLRLLERRPSFRHVLCPACHHFLETKGYGWYVCNECGSSVNYSHKGIST